MTATIDIYDECEQHVERFLARTAAFEQYLLEDKLLEHVKTFGYAGVVFALKGGSAFASLDGVIGIGRTPSAALADALAKIAVPEAQS